ncbi:hypothetical protein M419DRAFT_35667 [Trichoderma reesei RUT C-30]|uniref:F-box domain-containing protein n=1 Tax=Hypocrea jecorina (strain ATCC 56765 / BCRC 32924 / NRRL 11460 / Rut C-30) TaxID=1344414 RepID=A0A024SCE7_HYPJR|nr:hypothetical protein M419DRAFT_35667 [Trichoderma reesei RUT C-30]
MTSSHALIRLIVGTSSRASWNAHSPILQLPPEMILCIADHLDLQDLFILSQVCRAFRHLVHRDWNGELFRLRPRDQYRFWVGLALIRPAFWACGRCCSMHRVVDGPDSDTRPIAWNPSILGWRRLPCGAHYRERGASQVVTSRRSTRGFPALMMLRRSPGSTPTDQSSAS